MLIWATQIQLCASTVIQCGVENRPMHFSSRAPLSRHLLSNRPTNFSKKNHRVNMPWDTVVSILHTNSVLVFLEYHMAGGGAQLAAQIFTSCFAQLRIIDTKPHGNFVPGIWAHFIVFKISAWTIIKMTIPLHKFSNSSFKSINLKHIPVMTTMLPPAYLDGIQKISVNGFWPDRFTMIEKLKWGRFDLICEPN